jgi:hypothetical protein
MLKELAVKFLQNKDKIARQALEYDLFRQGDSRLQKKIRRDREHLVMNMHVQVLDVVME